MFITLEGPEGSGKTSHVAPLIQFLKEKGYAVFATREPGGTSIGEQVRDVIHDLNNREMRPRTETLLYQAARAQIVEQVIQPHLSGGDIVISDRFADSTIAYQGYGHRQDLEQVRALVKYATGGLTPDLTILLDVDVELGLQRKTQNGSEWNRMDDYTSRIPSAGARRLPRNGEAGASQVDGHRCEPGLGNGAGGAAQDHP